MRNCGIANDGVSIYPGLRCVVKLLLIFLIHFWYLPVGLQQINHSGRAHMICFF